MSHVMDERDSQNGGIACGEPDRIPHPAGTTSVPHMLYRHWLDLEHQVRSHSPERAHKLPRLLFAGEDILLLDPAAKPLLAFPNHLLSHTVHLLGDALQPGATNFTEPDTRRAP